MDTVYRDLLGPAIEAARASAEEGGIPIGAALFDENLDLVSTGHNRRIQDGDPTAHGEVNAFRNAGMRSSYAGMTMVSTLTPCWYCAGLVRMFGISRVVVGDTRLHRAAGSADWLRDAGVEVVILEDDESFEVLDRFAAEHPDVWDADSGSRPYEADPNRPPVG